MLLVLAHILSQFCGIDTIDTGILRWHLLWFGALNKTEVNLTVFISLIPHSFSLFFLFLSLSIPFPSFLHFLFSLSQIVSYVSLILKDPNTVHWL